MSNYIELEDTIAFHPGYYIEEIIENNKQTQEEFAKSLDITPEDLGSLIRGERRLGMDVAVKLSKVTSTSITLWLNLQDTYDSLIKESKS